MNILSKNQKIKKRIPSPVHKIRMFYFRMTLLILLFMLFCLFFICLWPYMFTKPKLEKVTETNSSSSSFINVSYNFYLDFSNSMEGFISGGENMQGLAKTLQYVNSNSLGENSFYYYVTDVEECTSDVFYKYMSEPVEIQQYYQEIQRSAEELAKLEKEIDLSDIFSDINFSNDESQLNVIITDLNFYYTANGSDKHDELIERFSKRLANAAGNTNIVIYQIVDNYRGKGVDQVDFEGIAAMESKDASFFLIVFSQNDVAYTDYISRLEQALASERVSCQNRLEIQNNLLKENHTLFVDDSLYNEESNAFLNNFYRNNGYIFQRKSNEMGLFLAANGERALFRGNVAPLNIDELVAEGQNAKNESQVTVKTKIHYGYSFFDIHEYMGNSPVLVQAGIVQDQKELYLSLNMECGTSVRFPRALFLNKDYFVVELMFFLEKPDYKAPQWAVDIDTESGRLDLDRKRGFSNFVELLLTAKEEQFERNATDYEKYLGSLAVYIDY